MSVGTEKKSKVVSAQSSRFVKFIRDTAVDVSQLKKISSSRKRQLDEAFVKMMVLDYQPLTIGERRGMRHLVTCAVPGYQPPCYWTVRDTLIPASMRQVEENLK